MNEIIQTIGKPVDMLSNQDMTNEAIRTLEGAKLNPEIIEAFAKLANLGRHISTIDEYREAGMKSVTNSVTGLYLEDKVKSPVFTVIENDVVNGEYDLAIIETDVNGLKGLNDNYGEHEADKGLKKFADSIVKCVIETINASGEEIKFAIVNKHGEGSDSIKIILVGKSLMKIVRNILEERIHTKVTAKLKKLGYGNEEDVDIKGEWGFFVLKNKEAQELKKTLSIKGTTGKIYDTVSTLAENKMVAQKVRKEADLINRIFDASTIEELEKLRKEITKYGPRIPQVILEYYDQKKIQLESKR